MQSGPIEIPNKSSFKINEVCALTGVKSYVLRFWESEFPEIAPIQSSSGVKLYEHRDIEVILQIKKLLFEEKYSIEKAKASIKSSMPNEQLLEDAYSEIDEDQNFDSHIVSDLHLKESSVKRVLIDSEFKKLMEAKFLLNGLVDRINSVEQTHHWR